jgi:uncharacterized protein (DUF1800 family)
MPVCRRNELDTDAVIAVNRFGLGARPGELETAGRNPRHWLLDQLDGPSRTPSVIRALPDSADVIVGVQAARREAKNDAANKSGPGRMLRGNYLEQTEARYALAATTSLPFHERLVHFFSNHFAVSADKPPLPGIAGLYENEAIRPNVSGRFADLLIAVEQHPAMILYLDNQRSIGPNSTLGKRAGRRRSERSIGLNENLAREILELHTLGVDGGYSQDDVTALARVITGWSLGGGNDKGRFNEGTPGTFEFRQSIHEPGRQTVLGKRYDDDGVRQGEAVLRDLATHPATARHLATKLARHFVADQPPADLVDRMTRTYLETDGDIPSVCADLVHAEHAWHEPLTKYKSPHDVFVSTCRAIETDPGDGRRIVGMLESLGQVPWRPGSPAGWPDTAEQWGGADALYKRIEFADTVARLTASGVDPVRLGERVLGDAMQPSTRQSVQRAESRQQGLTLLFASPDFQRR